ncbi:MAG: cell division protein SepF [Candidatus Nanopelagicales bacterium]
MAGAMRKMAVYLGLVEDDPDRYDDTYDEYDDEPGEQREARDLQPVRDDAPTKRAATSTSMGDYRITTLHPRSYNDARSIGEHFREGSPVIINLTDMDDADAKRLVDFAAGLVFGLRGTIERVTAKVFLLSPANVVVTAEERARLAEGGFFNQS